MAIGFLTTDLFKSAEGISPGGCGYYRCLLPGMVIGESSRMGFPAWDGIRGFGVSESESTAIFGFSTVMLKLVMSRWTPRQVELAKALGQRVVVDVDDHYEALTEENAAWHVTHPEKNKVTNREHYARVIELCDTLTVSTPELLDVYWNRHPDVRMIRNGILPESFHVKRQSDRPVIGWVGSTLYRSGDLDVLKGWLPEFLEEHDLMFHHAGHFDGPPSFGEIVGIPPERISYSPLVGIDYYPLLLMAFDIGLVPLTDIPFNRAKSNIKGLEYAAAGLPFIASPLPEYEHLAADGVGRLAGTPEEWRLHLEELLDLKVRKKEAAQQRRIVTERHSIYQRAGDWRDALVG